MEGNWEFGDEGESHLVIVSLIQIHHGSLSGWFASPLVFELDVLYCMLQLIFTTKIKSERAEKK